MGSGEYHLIKELKAPAVAIIRRQNGMPPLMYIFIIIICFCFFIITERKRNLDLELYVNIKHEHYSQKNKKFLKRKSLIYVKKLLALGVTYVISVVFISPHTRLLIVMTQHGLNTSSRGHRPT